MAIVKRVSKWCYSCGSPRYTKDGVRRRHECPGKVRVRKIEDLSPEERVRLGL